MSWFRKKKDEPAAGSPPPAPRETGPAPTAHPDIVARLRTLVAHGSKGRLTDDMIDPGAPLFDCGYVDSLSSVELLAAIERIWGVRVPEARLVGTLDSLDRLAEHLTSSPT